MTADRGLDVDVFVASAIAYLQLDGALVVEPSGQDAEGKYLTVTTDMINNVLAKGSVTVKRDCPHKRKLCGGCVIL